MKDLGEFSMVVGFKSFVFHMVVATLQGAGHAVPEYKPKEALAFYSRWLAGEKF